MYLAIYDTLNLSGRFLHGMRLWVTPIFFLTSVFIHPVCAQEDSLSVSADTSAIAVVMESVEPPNDQLDSIENQDVHPQDSPPNRGFLIITSDGKAELRIRGSLRVNGAYDLNGLQNKNNFSTYDIPVGRENKTEPRFFMSARQSRLGLEATRKSRIGDIFMRIETDFLGAGNGLIRLRHAFLQGHTFIIGHTWATFSDVSSLPLTVDLQGPNSVAIERSIQFRYFRTTGNNFRWSVALESPRPEIRVPDSVRLEPAFQSFPDIAARLRKSADWGHVQLAATFRSITVKDLNSELDVLTGFGVLLSGNITFAKDNGVLFQGVYGSAISGFIKALSGKGLDVIYNPLTKEFEPIVSMGGFLTYKRQWHPEWVSFFTAGVVNVENKDFQPEDAFNLSRYVSANLFWEVLTGGRLGLEYSWGERINKDRDSGTANRISFIFIYDF